MDHIDRTPNANQPMETLNQKKRLTELDFMRTAGFIMVVAQHILGSYAGRPATYTGPALFFHVLFLFGRPAVPMFVALTAFTLFNSNYGKTFRGRTFFGKKSINIILPYLFWSFFYMLYYKKTEMLQNLVPVLITGQGSYHLWYVGMVTRIYLLFPLVLWFVSYVLRKRKGNGIWLMVGALAFFYGMNYWNGWLTANIAMAVGHGVKNFFVIRFLNYSPLYYSGYFAMGALYYFRQEQVKAWVKKYWGWLLLPYIPASVYMYILQSERLMPESLKHLKNFLSVRLIFMCLTIVLLLRLGMFVSDLAKKRSEAANWITLLGKLSFGAYLVHVLMINEIAKYYLTIFKPNGNLVAGLVVFTGTILLSFLIAYVLDRVPFMGYLVGTGRIKAKKKVNEKVDNKYSL